MSQLHDDTPRAFEGRMAGDIAAGRGGNRPGPARPGRRPQTDHISIRRMRAVRALPYFI